MDIWNKSQSTIIRVTQITQKEIAVHVGAKHVALWLYEQGKQSWKKI